MSHKATMQHGIYRAIDAMPRRMRPSDMALLFANFLITYEMEDDLTEIDEAVNKIIEVYVNDHGEDDVETMTAIKDADHFLAKVQAETRA